MKPCLVSILLLVLIARLGRAEENWPQWRGPNLNGTCDSKDLPLTWSETENIVWKTELPWWSGSTPIIWGDRIFLTSPEKSTPENQAGVPRREGSRDPGGPMLFLLCFNRADGKELWRRELGKGNALNRKGNKASPSPVTDGKNVWAVIGTGNIIAFDFDGKEIWRRNFQDEYGKFGQMWGYNSSPILYEDRLIFQVLHGYNTHDPSYLFAVDKLTGKTIWKTIRPTDAVKESPDAYSTPALLRYADRAEVVTSGGDAVTAHDPLSGKEIWRVGGFNPNKQPWNRTITSPLCVGDYVFAPSRRNPLLAIKAGGHGEVGLTHALWSYDKGPDVPTPVSDGKYLWIVDDQGIVSCLDVKTGKTTYDPKRIAAGTYTASLLLADGKILATTESATTTVLAATSEFKTLAVNQLDDEYTLASPIAVGTRIYIRTSTHLYCIGKK